MEIQEIMIMKYLTDNKIFNTLPIFSKLFVNYSKSSVRNNYHDFKKHQLIKAIIRKKILITCLAYCFSSFIHSLNNYYKLTGTTGYLYKKTDLLLISYLKWITSTNKKAIKFLTKSWDMLCYLKKGKDLIQRYKKHKP